MSNCYANIITLRGDKKQIRNAYFVLGDSFDLSGYWDKYPVFGDDDFNVVRMNDIGVLLKKNDTVLKYYIWTKWMWFIQELIYDDVCEEEKEQKIFPEGLVDLGSWTGVKNIEVLFYPAESFDQPTIGISKYKGLYSFWREEQFDWEITWHRHSYNYILELELKIHQIIISFLKLLDELYKESSPFTDKQDYKQEEASKSSKFSDYINKYDFVRFNKNELLKLVDDAKSRINRPPFSNWGGNGHTEKTMDIDAFIRKYSLG